MFYFDQCWNYYMQLLLFYSHYFCHFSRDEFDELHQRNPHSQRNLALAFICGEVDWVTTEPKPTEPLALVRDTIDTDAEWQKKQRNLALLQMAYDLDIKKWTNVNKKCVAVIKNTIEPTILGSTGESDSVTEYL